jgi:5-formyltetrahydrofolate cyclo-ligase
LPFLTRSSPRGVQPLDEGERQGRDELGGVQTGQLGAEEAGAVRVEDHPEATREPPAGLSPEGDERPGNTAGACHTAGVGAAPGRGEEAAGERDLRTMKRARRAEILSARAARGERDRARAGEALAQVVADLPAIRRARCVAAYVSREDEPPTQQLLEVLAARGLRILLPVVGGERRLVQGWAEYAGAAALTEPSPGRPLEPSGPDLGAAEIGAADVVLLPALAVDTAGTRLGYGAGWYDQALAHVRPGTPLIALVYEDEVLDAAQAPLPRSAHDRAVGSAATPQGWVAFETTS